MKSISNQILLSILFTIIIAFGGWGIYEIENTKIREEKLLFEKQTAVADRLSVSLEYPITHLNNKEVERQIKSQTQSESILSIRVLNDFNKPYGGIVRNNKHFTNIIEKNWSNIKGQAITRPILHKNRSIGKVVVYANKKPLNTLISNLRFKLILELIILIFIITTVLYLILRKVIIKPLSTLKDWAASVDSNHMLPTPDVFQSKEINSLMNSFSLMTNRLVSSHNKISEKNRQLIDSESRIKSISDNFTSGMIYQLIIKTDGTRTFTHLSDSVKFLYGITPTEGIADSSLIYNNIHPEDIESLIKAEDEAMKSLSTFRKEVRMKDPSGKYRWSAFVSKPTLQDDGSVCWDGIEFDITNLKKAEEELQISQQKFVLAFNSSPGAIFISEQETGQIIECNEATVNIFGYSREEILGKTTLELGIYKNSENRLKIIETAKEFGYVRNMEVTGLHKSGNELTIIVSLEICQINNKPHFIVTVNDITERKKIEQELRISQEKFISAFHSSPDAIFISDQETGEFIEINSSVETIFGYRREEVMGKTGLGLNLYKNPEDRQKIIDLLLKNGFVNKAEVLGRHKSGRDLNVLLTVGLEKINGRPCFITTVHDITERKKIEEKLRISQQKFAIAFNSSPDAILITEQETGIIIEANNAIETVFGFSREEIIGKTGKDLNIYNDPEDRQKAINEFKKTGHLRDMEIIRKHKSGSDLVLLLSVESSIIEGKPCYISTHHDITQQKKAEEKLRQSEERYKSIISVSNTGAWEYHTDTDYLWCSPEYFSMLGLNQSDFDISGNKNLQETWIDLLHPDDREHSTNHFAEYLNNGSMGIYENHFRMKHVNGNWVWIWSRGQTLRDSEGNVTNLTVGTHIDITERKLTEIELQKLNLDKDRFISILSHDLRGPFNSILSVLDLLCLDHNIKKEESEELLQLAYKSAKNTSSLLDNVLTWATAQSGKMTFNPEIINFQENTKEIVELLEAIANDKNIRIELHSNDNLMINADKNMIRTILRNLISNALKFTNKGGNITVSAGKIGDLSIISVSDNGVGIDPKNISKIFDKGQLFTSTGTANEKGTGFGLKLCQELVEKHKGKIWVESELGKGTIFYFTLPDPTL